MSPGQARAPTPHPFPLNPWRLAFSDPGPQTRTPVSRLTLRARSRDALASARIAYCEQTPQSAFFEPYAQMHVQTDPSCDCFRI